MKCPACNVELLMTDRQGVEIDYCSKCRGVWLDRGELDKLIDRATNTSPKERYESEYRHNSGDEHYKHRKRKSLIGEIFDF